MSRVFLILLAAACCTARGKDGWTLYTPRPENAPKLVRTGEDLRVVGGGNPAVYGGWERRFDAQPGRWYRFAARYHASGVKAENWQVVARLDWVAGDGKRAGQPDYAAWTRVQDGARSVEAFVRAPDQAASVRVQLILAAAPDGDVTWSRVELAAVPPPAPRNVRVASLNLRPDKTASPAQSVEQFITLIRSSVPPQTDLILLPEGITVVGTGRSYAEVAEPIPGPTTERLSEVARDRKAWVAAGIYEREGKVLYNTAVLIDREGRLAGKYRKVYLPREELERGLTPGDSYPVFRTDFGIVGLMICYDVFFADPARALAAQGAELILLPIWGGDETLAKARAIENKVFLAASGYDHPTYIMDPDGMRVSEARERGTVAVSTIDLEKRYADPWLGEMRTRRLKELRLDVAMPQPGLRP